MTTKTKASTAERPLALAEPCRPTHRLYRVTGDGEAAIWIPIGAAWPNKDGKGFNLNCDRLRSPGASFCGLSSPTRGRR